MTCALKGLAIYEWCARVVGFAAKNLSVGSLGLRRDDFRAWDSRCNGWALNREH